MTEVSFSVGETRDPVLKTLPPPWRKFTQICHLTSKCTSLLFYDHVTVFESSRYVLWLSIECPLPFFFKRKRLKVNSGFMVWCWHTWCINSSHSRKAEKMDLPRYDLPWLTINKIDFGFIQTISNPEKINFHGDSSLIDKQITYWS